jgi:chromosome segregation ATPase
VHYQNPKNIVSNSPDRHAIPMVAVYLLGHTVGDIEAPVVYVRHKAFDYNDEPLQQGIPDKFIDSLNHDSIIVQIPRLHGKINNRLDKVLSIFDQSRVNQENQHYLDLDNRTIDAADEDMQPIFHRLIMAAASIEMRQDMNVEDEYYSIIKEQEGRVYGLEREMAEVKGQLDETKGQLDETKGQLDETKGQLDETKGQLDETKGQLDETKGQLDATKGQLDATKGQLDATKGQLDATKGQLDETKGQLDETKGQLQILVRSLVQSGRKIEDIAGMLNLDVESARALL